MAEQTDNNWHLDKKVQLPVIFLLASQIVAGVWFASAFNSRVTALEEKFTETTKRLEVFTTERDSTRDRLLRLEEQNRSIYETVKRIEVRLDPPRRSDIFPQQP